MKSHFFSELVVEECLMNSGFRVVCVREIQKSLKESAKRLIEDKIKGFGLEHDFRILNDYIETPGGGIILFHGMADHSAESIKSLEGFDRAWVEEGQTLSARSLEFLRPTIRKPGSELWFGWNPRSKADPVDMFFRGEHPPEDTIIANTNWRDNPWFPAVLTQERRHDVQFKRERYGHIWEGDYEPQAIGSLWNRAMLHSCRKDNLPEMKRIVVAIDPAISNEAHSDEHGITVCGLGEDQKGYLLEDGSLRGSPLQCAKRAVSLYDKWHANKIIYEKNNGGKWIDTTLKSIRQGLPVGEVCATRGKYIRAEPIASLYELGVIHHYGVFVKLEDQMCLMVSGDYAGEGSPDRVCSAVWGFTELFPNIVNVQEKKQDSLSIPDQKRI